MHFLVLENMAVKALTIILGSKSSHAATIQADSSIKFKLFYPNLFLKRIPKEKSHNARSNCSKS